VDHGGVERVVVVLAEQARDQLVAAQMNSIVSPWHQWLDPEAYGRHVDEVEALGLLIAASAHGPVMTGDAIHRAFDTVRRLAGRPIIPTPGQELLDELVASALAGAGA
jgi:hypothetical protein